MCQQRDVDLYVPNRCAAINVQQKRAEESARKSVEMEETEEIVEMEE